MEEKRGNRTDPELKKLMRKPAYYEELLLVTAQELIAQLMERENVSKADLARKLNKSKAHVTSLLADGRNLTLKSLANVCYHLGSEVRIDAQPIQQGSDVNANSYQDEKGAAVMAAPHFYTSTYTQ